MKLLIAIPTLDFVHVDFMKSLLKLTEQLRDGGIPYEIKIISGTLVYLAREELVSYALSYEFTHVLWLDSDMVFTDQLFDDLNDVGKPFVTGIFHARRPGHQSCIFRSLNPPERFKWNEYPDVPFLIGGCGMAATLTSAEILQAVRKEFGLQTLGRQLGNVYAQTNKNIIDIRAQEIETALLLLAHPSLCRFVSGQPEAQMRFFGIGF